MSDFPLTDDQLTRLTRIAPSNQTYEEYVEYLQRIASHMGSYLEDGEWHARWSTQYNMMNGFGGSDVHYVAREICEIRADDKRQWRLKDAHHRGDQ